MKFKKSEQVSARLHGATKAKLAHTGYNAAEAIEWFVHEWYSHNPQRRVSIERDMLEIRLHNLKQMECEVQTEIGVVESKLDELLPVNVPEEPINEIELLPDNLQEAVKRIRPVYEDKRDLIVGKNTSPSEALDVFIALNGDFVRNVYSECKGVKWKEFKQVLISEVIM